jgi:hypothetical protein
MTPTRSRRIVRRAVMALAGGVLLAVGGCGNRLEDLAFVLPANYTGPFVVVEGPNAPEIPYQNGAYTINVPESGVVRVKSAALFGRETNQTARRGDRDIPISIGESGMSWHFIGAPTPEGHTMCFLWEPSASLTMPI